MKAVMTNDQKNAVKPVAAHYMPPEHLADVDPQALRAGLCELSGGDIGYCKTRCAQHCLFARKLIALEAEAARRAEIAAVKAEDAAQCAAAAPVEESPCEESKAVSTVQAGAFPPAAIAARRKKAAEKAVECARLIQEGYPVGDAAAMAGYKTLSAWYKAQKSFKTEIAQALGIEEDKQEQAKEEHTMTAINTRKPRTVRIRQLTGSTGTFTLTEEGAIIFDPSIELDSASANPPSVLRALAEEIQDAVAMFEEDGCHDGE